MPVLNEGIIELPGTPLELIEIGTDGVILASSKKKNIVTFYNFSPNGKLLSSFEEVLESGETYEVFRGNDLNLFYRFNGRKTVANLISVSLVAKGYKINAQHLLDFIKKFKNILKPSAYGQWYEVYFSAGGSYDGSWLHFNKEPKDNSIKTLVFKTTTAGWMSPFTPNLYNLRIAEAKGKITNLIAGASRLKWQRQNCLASLANNKLQLAVVNNSTSLPPTDQAMHQLTFNQSGILKEDNEIPLPVDDLPVVPIAIDDRQNIYASAGKSAATSIPYYYSWAGNSPARSWNKLSNLVSARNRKFVDSSFCVVDPAHPKTHPSGIAALQPALRGEGSILVLTAGRVSKPFILHDPKRYEKSPVVPVKLDTPWEQLPGRIQKQFTKIISIMDTISKAKKPAVRGKITGSLKIPLAKK